MVKYLTYEEQQIPIRISYSALKGVKKDTGEDFGQLAMEMKDNPEKARELAERVDMYDMWESLLYHGLISGYRAEKKECPFGKDDIVDILDECFMVFTKLIPEFFPDADEVKKPKGRTAHGNSQKRK